MCSVGREPSAIGRIMPVLTRRKFLLGSGAALAVSGVPHLAFARPLYPPANLSYFDTPISRAPSAIRIGYAAITWDGHDRQAIEDIAALGYTGIQLRSNVLKEFNDDPSAVRDLLEQHKLKFVALSSGGVSPDPAMADVQFQTHSRNAKFLHDAGGLYLQLTDDRPKGRDIRPEDYKNAGALMTRIAKYAADLGIQVGYHNHMGSMGQTPEGVVAMLRATDPRYVKLELDIAHYFQGGGDPATAIHQYHDRLLFLHIKDVLQKPAASNPKDSYQFVELGEGKVNIPAVFDALKQVKFRGWAIVELDGERDSQRTPKESAEISKKFIAERLGLGI